MKRRMVSAMTLTLLLTSMLMLAFHVQSAKARPDFTIGFYGITHEVYSDSLVSYLKTLGYTVFAVDELTFPYADIVYLDYRDVNPLNEEDLLNYVENGGSLWVGGEACGGAFLGVTISTNSIWFDGSLSNPRVSIFQHPVLQEVRSIAYPDGAWLEIIGDIHEIMRIDGKTMLAVSSLGSGKILWLIDSDIFGDYFLDDQDNRILARNIAAWLCGALPPRAYTLAITTTVGGTTDPASGSYNYTANSSVQVTAIPNANYLFEHWELDGVNVGAANPYTVLIDMNHTLKAFFAHALLGDCNGDSVVDISDLAMVAGAFGSYLGHPRWNEAVDVHEDGIIDVFDLVTVAMHFGEIG